MCFLVTKLLNYYHSTIQFPDSGGRQPVKFDFIILISIKIKYPLPIQVFTSVACTVDTHVMYFF